MDLDSFCAGLERAAQFHDEQAHICRLAIDAEYPTKHRADEQRDGIRHHEWCAKAVRGMKTNYESGKLEIPHR